MEGTIQTAKELAAKLNGNYVQVVKKNGKTHDKLFKDPQKAIRAVGGVDNVKYLREILKEQVNAKYISEDSLTGTPENEL
jgi:tRNA A37 threonylcarbamoyltransferase TsaD